MNNLDEIIEVVSEIVEFINHSKDSAEISLDALDRYGENINKYLHFWCELSIVNRPLSETLRETNLFSTRLIILKYFKMTGNLS